VAPRGYTATAAEFLDLAADDSDMLAALQGIGYGLLAIADQLADVAGTGAGCGGRLGEIAGLYSEPLGSRALGTLRRLARRAHPDHAREAGVPGTLAGVYDPTDVPGNVPGDAHGGQVIPLDVLRRPACTVVPDADAGLVSQALADAAAWRAWKAEGAGCAGCARLDPGRCADHAADDDLAAAYEALRDRLAGGAS